MKTLEKYCMIKNPFGNIQCLLCYLTFNTGTEYVIKRHCNHFYSFINKLNEKEKEKENLFQKNKKLYLEKLKQWCEGEEIYVTKPFSKLKKEISSLISLEIVKKDSNLLNVTISLRQLEEISKEISSRGHVSGLNEVAWALKALSLTDLTTLAGDDTESNVRRLCHRAAYPLPMHLVEQRIAPTLHKQIHTGAVCVYPARVADARRTFEQLSCEDNIPIAAVATGFPTGQYGLKTRLDEITFAINEGAREIDIVINRPLALTEKWKELYDEVCEMRKACGSRAHLKTILAIGELGSMENVYKASMVCMMAGADFIKTSTGKESVNATIPVGLVMIWAIQEFMRKTGQIVGLKPAGGVRTVREAITWMTLVKETLGMQWLQPNLFRFGASGLLDDIEKVVRKALTGYEIQGGPVAAY